jgi:hypothetical protein
MSELSDLINAALARKGWDGMSVRELAAASDGALSKDNVAIYRRGAHGVPDERTLRAWSEITGLSVGELRAAAGVPAGEGEPWVPPVESARLSRRQRVALEELIRAFVAPVAESDESERDSHGLRRTSASVSRLNNGISELVAASETNNDKGGSIDSDGVIITADDDGMVGSLEPRKTPGGAVLSADGDPPRRRRGKSSA